MRHEIIRWIGRAARAIVLALSLYVAAGLVGGAIPVNAGWHPPVTGVRIYVESNGVHTGLVMPANAAGVDWDAAFPAADIADPRFARLGWVAVGWGDRVFYTETPHWSDLRPRTVLRAAIGGGPTVLHVEHVGEPPKGDEERAVTLTPDQYRRLAAFIRASRGPGGRVAPGYGAYDVFYDARGSYNALVTCNEWTGRALRTAGVRVGAWTPFPLDVTAWF